MQFVIRAYDHHEVRDTMYLKNDNEMPRGGKKAGKHGRKDQRNARRITRVMKGH